MTCKLKHKLRYNEFTFFEKRYGDVEGIEDVIIERRRKQYVELLEKEPTNYDLWFDLIRLEESVGKVTQK